MKYTQTSNQVIIRQGGASKLVGGILCSLFGLGIIYTIGYAAHTTDGSTNNTTFAWVFGGAFVLSGLAIAFFASSRLTTITQGGQAVVSAKRLIGGKSSSQDFPTSSIVKVNLSTYFDTQSDTDNTSTTNASRQSRLSLVLQDNSTVVVAVKSKGTTGFAVNGINLGSLVQKAPLAGEAQKLAAFLGVPLDTSDLTTISGTVDTFKQMYSQARADQTPLQVATPVTPSVQSANPGPAAAAVPQVITPIAQEPNEPTEPTKPTIG